MKATSYSSSFPELLAAVSDAASPSDDALVFAALDGYGLDASEAPHCVLAVALGLDYDAHITDAT